MPSAASTHSPSYAVGRHQSPLSMSMAVLLGLWTLAILIAPMYVFPSGVPQPADFLCVFVLLCLYALGRLRWDTSANQVLKRLMLFVLYACVVNFVWAGLLYGYYAKSHELPSDLLLSGIYYLFNLCIATAVASMVFWMGGRFINGTMLAILLSIVIQAIAAWQTEGVNEAGERTTAFFENPNQLAYFAVLNASLLLVLGRSGRASRWIQWLLPFAFVILVYLALVSSSRAGLAGIGLACILLYIDNFQRGLLLTLAFIGVLATGLLHPIAEALVDRSLEKNQGFWEEMGYRGYDRMWNHPEYLVFGSGEGQYERFRSAIEIELHSTPGTLLFSYGLVGSILFILPLWFILRTKGLRTLLMLLPVLVYGLSHHGLRQAELWMLIALLGCNLTVRDFLSEEHEEGEEEDEAEEDDDVGKNDEDLEEHGDSQLNGRSHE